MVIKNSDVVSGSFYNKLVKSYKEYDKKQKQIIYDLSNENYDLKQQLEKFEKETDIPEYDDPIMKAFIEVIANHCDRQLFLKVCKWLKIASKSNFYRSQLCKCEKRIHELRKELDELRRVKEDL